MNTRSVSYQLRPAVRAESDELYAIHRAAMESYVAETWGTWDDTWQRQFWVGHWYDDRQTIVVHEQVVGFLDIEERAAELWIANIELDPRSQGVGIGSAILRDIQASAASRGLGVALQVLKVNPARRLYERLGFRHTGESDTHYAMTWSAHEG